MVGKPASVGNTGANLFRHRQCIPLRGFGEQQDEFLPTDTKQRVELAQAAFQQRHHARQHLIAGGVAKLVIDALEPRNGS